MHTTDTHTPTTLGTRMVCAVLVAVTAAGAFSSMTGCRGDRSRKPPRQFFPGMDDQPKWKAQNESEFFADNRMMRPRVEGTVAFSRVAVSPAMFESDDRLAVFAHDREDLLGENMQMYFGTNGDGGDDGGDGSFLDTIPVEVTTELIARGKQRYDIFCSMCHGYEGESVTGERPATVGQRFAIAPANLHDPKYKDAAQRQGKDGYLFNVVRHGVWSQWTFADGKAVPGGNQTMPGYSHGVGVRDAWAIVAYVRTLQQLGPTVPVPATAAPELSSQPEGEPNPMPPGENSENTNAGEGGTE